MATRQLRQPRRTLPWLIAVLISSSLFSALASPYERNHLDGASRPLESIGRDRYGLLTAAWSRFPSNFWPNMFGERNDFAYFAGRSDRLFVLVDKGNGATLRCYTLSKGTAKQEWAEPLSQKQGLRSSKGTLETYVIAEGYHIPTPGRASKADLARREPIEVYRFELPNDDEQFFFYIDGRSAAEATALTQDHGWPASHGQLPIGPAEQAWVKTHRAARRTKAVRSKEQLASPKPPRRRRRWRTTRKTECR